MGPRASSMLIGTLCFWNTSQKTTAGASTYLSAVVPLQSRIAAFNAPLYNRMCLYCAIPEKQNHSLNMYLLAGVAAFSPAKGVSEEASNPLGEDDLDGFTRVFYKDTKLAMLVLFGAFFFISNN